jgi:hypothetical protein
MYTDIVLAGIGQMTIFVGAYLCAQYVRRSQSKYAHQPLLNITNHPFAQILEQSGYVSITSVNQVSVVGNTGHITSFSSHPGF